MLTHKTFDHLRKITMKTHTTIPSLTTFQASWIVGLTKLLLLHFWSQLELEPEGTKYDCNSDRKSAPERVSTLFIIHYSLLILLLLITKWRIEENRSSFDGETTTGTNTDVL